jgi:hypothetical protein
VGDLGAESAGLVESLGGGDGVDRESRPARMAAVRTGCCDSSGGALGGDGAFKLGDGPEDVEDQRAPRVGWCR